MSKETHGRWYFRHTHQVTNSSTYLYCCFCTGRINGKLLMYLSVESRVYVFFCIIFDCFLIYKHVKYRCVLYYCCRFFFPVFIFYNNILLSASAYYIFINLLTWSYETFLCAKLEVLVNLCTVCNDKGNITVLYTKLYVKCKLGCVCCDWKFLYIS